MSSDNILWIKLTKTVKYSKVSRVLIYLHLFRELFYKDFLPTSQKPLKLHCNNRDLLFKEWEINSTEHSIVLFKMFRDLFLHIFKAQIKS